MITAQVLVLAKAPRAGFSKTRLTPPLSPEQAADIATASLGDTLEAVLRTPAARRTIVLDGAAGAWVPPSFEIQPQHPGTFNERLDAAFAEAWVRTPLPLLLIGMDTPQVTPALLTGCLQQLLSPGTDAVLGTAADGGWWALGLHRPVPGLFDGIEMSTDRTGAQQADRLAALQLRTTRLPVLRDIDLVTDLHEVAALMPTASRLTTAVNALSTGTTVHDARRSA